MRQHNRFFLFAIFFLFSFAIFARISFAETDVNGDEISQDTEWTLANSPYIVYASPTIDAGATLTIDAGVIVKFDYGQSINVSGNLIANGTADQEIYFTSLYDDSVGGDIPAEDASSTYYNDSSDEPGANSGDWQGINILSGGNYNLENTEILYASNALVSDNATGAIDSLSILQSEEGISAVNTSTIHITNSFFSDISGDAFFLDATSTASILNSSFENISGDAAIVADNSTLDFENSSETSVSGYALITYNQSTSSAAILQVNGSDGIVLFQNSFFDFENSTIENTAGTALTLFSNSFATLTDVNIHKAGEGIDVFDESNLTLSDSDIANITNPYGSAATVFDGSSLSIGSSSIENIAGEGFDIFNDPDAATTTFFCASSSMTTGSSTALEMSGSAVSANISESSILNFSANGVLIYSDATLAIADTTISENKNGIENYGGNITVTNSTIASNTAYGIFNIPAGFAPEIEAENNYWGDASGPFNADTNANGTGNAASDNVDFSNWLLAPPNQKKVLPACCSNVLFIPGLEASRLYDENGNQIWEPDLPWQNSEMDLDANGEPLDQNIYTKDIIDNAYVPDFGNIYYSFIQKMNAMKSSGEINDWAAAPYDWRLSLADILENGNENSSGNIFYSGQAGATTTPYIISELRALAATSQTGKVTIIAHSNGGLVAKALTDALGPDASKLIDQIIFVAVPQVGTPSAIGGILHGFEQGLLKDWLPVFFTPENARELGVNMPSAYNLLPSADYFSTVGDPVITFDNSDLLAPWVAKYGSVISSQSALQSFITDASRPALPVTNAITFPISGNANLATAAESEHENELDDWTPPAGVALTEIAGWGEDTLKTISYYQGWAACNGIQIDFVCLGTANTPVLQYDPEMSSDGDGTVLVPSALWTASSTSAGKYWVNLQGYSKEHIFKSAGTFLPFTHADILEVSDLLTFIQNLIMKNSAPLPTYISTSSPPDTSLPKMLHFTLHSPLSLGVSDDAGDFTGIASSGEIQEGIPDSDYETYGEVQYISVPASSTIHVVMNGYASGSFTFDMQETDGDTIIASTTFAAVPTNASTTATINIPDGDIASSSDLSVDENGDGTDIINLAPVLDTVVAPDFPTSTPTITQIANNISAVAVQSFGSSFMSDPFSNISLIQIASTTPKIIVATSTISTVSKTFIAMKTIPPASTAATTSSPTAKIVQAASAALVAQTSSQVAAVGTFSFHDKILLAFGLLLMIIFIGIKIL